ncbi:MAG: tRNA A-37 threonylcarbamoyl transferase component Bud32 [Bacteroidia bacterium]|jgi:tRNA A-37 threonylcarbamoyl transferase component Bud32
MTPPPSPKNPAPKPGSHPPCARFALPGGAIWLSSAKGTAPNPELLAAGLDRRGQKDAGSWVPFGAGSDRAWVKGGRLSWKSALRHGASRAFLGRAVPRMREMGNLIALIERGVPAAEPLLAGVERGPLGQPTLQFLATREVLGAVDLGAYLKEAKDQQRQEVMADAGRLASLMHQAGFAHRNFFLRNLVRQPSGALTILDPWRGQFERAPRCHVVDLAGFLADAGLRINELDSERFLESYADASRGTIATPSRAALHKATAHESRRIQARDQRRRTR